MVSAGCLVVFVQFSNLLISLISSDGAVMTFDCHCPACSVFFFFFSFFLVDRKYQAIVGIE